MIQLYPTTLKRNIIGLKTSLGYCDYLERWQNIRVNSLILSVNSPYLEMIEKKNLKTIEMYEFDAV